LMTMTAANCLIARNVRRYAQAYGHLKKCAAAREKMHFLI
jgi:hypothetical protein